MEDEELKAFIEAGAEQLVSQLLWHDTLDVQNAVRKSFEAGVRKGLEYKMKPVQTEEETDIKKVFRKQSKRGNKMK
jgi:hypothetical protein